MHAIRGLGPAEVVVGPTVGSEFALILKLFLHLLAGENWHDLLCTNHEVIDCPITGGETDLSRRLLRYAAVGKESQELRAAASSAHVKCDGPWPHVGR